MLLTLNEIVEKIEPNIKNRFIIYGLFDIRVLLEECRSICYMEEMKLLKKKFQKKQINIWNINKLIILNLKIFFKENIMKIERELIVYKTTNVVLKYDFELKKLK